MDHETYMRRCLELAAEAGDRGDTPVGALIVFDGRVVGEASEGLPTGRLVTGHAEVLAVQRAADSLGGPDLPGGTLYTTAEPCFMCSYIIRQARISCVVYGRSTPLIGGITSSHPILVSADLDAWRPAPETIGGVLEEECLSLSRRATGDR
jgi:tRNA(adenine34) deaminase